MKLFAPYPRPWCLNLSKPRFYMFTRGMFGTINTLSTIFNCSIIVILLWRRCALVSQFHPSFQVLLIQNIFPHVQNMNTYVYRYIYIYIYLFIDLCTCMSMYDSRTIKKSNAAQDALSSIPNPAM